MNKRWIVGTIAFLGASVALGQPVLAQAGGGVNPGLHHKLGQLKKLADYLGLTADQKAQIKPIMRNTAQQVKAVRQDTALTPAQKKAKIKAIRQASRQQIMQILTQEQKAKLAALRQRKTKPAGA